MTPTQTPTRWLHAFALLTVGLTLIQLLLGSVVTSLQVGMADPQWPSAPWYLAQIKWGDYSAGYLIEHTHRLSGYILGTAVIVLTVWVWVRRRGLLRWLATAALLGVIVQGLLGGFRVVLHAWLGLELAMIHGTLGQVYFAFMACLGMLLAPGCESITWASLRQAELPKALRLWSWLTPALILTQIGLGALLRHTLDPVWQRLHLMVPFVVVAAILVLKMQVGRIHPKDLWARRYAMILSALVVLQIMLGVESWLVRFSAGVPAFTVVPTMNHLIVRTGHVLGGALLLGTATTLGFWLRRSVVVPETVPEPERELEGVA